MAPASQVFSGVIGRDAIEDMAGAVRQFFDLEAEQLEPGPCRCRIDFIAAGQTFLYREHYPLRTRLAGELLGNRFGLALPLCGPEVKLSGEEMGPSLLASAMTGEEIDLLAAGGLKQLVVLLDHERLLQTAEQAGLPREVQSALRRGRTSMPLVAKPQAVAAFSQRLRHLLRQAAVGNLQIAADQFEEWVYGQTLSILDVKEQPVGRPPAAVLVRRAIEITDDCRGPVPVAALCRLLRVSPGTLENAFKSATGVTPHAFFLRRRLTHARNLLLRETPEQRKVTEIASELGFSELGRFAVRYRQMFGESPSETLRRRVGMTK
jgi:AraC family ethanolamine operon transcriptional activator